MLSAEDIASMKLSVQICNETELKRNILCAPGSDYDMNINFSEYHVDAYDPKELWSVIIERKAGIILEKIGLAEHLKEKIMSVVLSVGLTMLVWAEYHENTLGFTRECSINFLNSSFFTTKGLIDNKNAAEMLMKDKSLSIKQKYKLACLYCFSEHIPALYGQLIRRERKEFYHVQYHSLIEQSKIVKFWSYYLMGDIDELKEDKDIDQYRLEMAIESGSKAAVQYCFEDTNSARNADAFVDAALETLRKGVRFTKHTDEQKIFGNFRYIKDSSWIPSGFYVDILCFLFSRMREDQQIEVLKKDIEDVNCCETNFINPTRSRVLEYFLDSPYQCYFMKTADMMWDFLPERGYAYTLLLICDKIEPKEIITKYGEGKNFDYRNLLRVFWSQSPEHYRRYVLSDKDITDVNGCKEKLKDGNILFRLLTLEHFTYEDWKNIVLILASATDEEKENIINSEEGKNTCLQLIEGKRFKLLDEFVSISFSSKEQVDQFKRTLSFAEKATMICIIFMKNNKWNAAESFIRWSALPEKEIIRLKREMVSSRDGKRVCRDLFYHEGVEIANKFCEWFLSSEKEITAFKKEMVFGEGISRCKELISEDKFELVDKFINWGLSAEEGIRKLKTIVAKSSGHYFCRDFILAGKWEQVEKFLTWCYSSENEIIDFKENLLWVKHKDKGYMGFLIEMHRELIANSRWKDAEMLIAWLGLSFEEIRRLKTETLLSESGMRWFQKSLFYGYREKYKDFVEYNWAEIELFLRWCLIDKDAVVEFRDKFDKMCGLKRCDNNEKEFSEGKRAAISEFNLITEALFNGLNQKSGRKNSESENLTGFPNKRFRTAELENKGTNT